MAKGVLKMLPISAIQVLPALQMRDAGLNEEHVEDLRTAIKRGHKLPRVIVYHVETEERTENNVPVTGYYATDGFHTYEAHKLEGRKQIAVVLHKGKWADAMLAASQANQGPTHQALKRTNADKIRAVKMATAAHPDYTDRRIAEALGVSHEFVGKHRADPTKGNGDPSGDNATSEPVKRVGKGGRTYSARRRPRRLKDGDDGVATGDTEDFEKGQKPTYDWKTLDTAFGIVHRAPKDIKKTFEKDSESTEYEGLDRLSSEWWDLLKILKKRLEKGK